MTKIRNRSGDWRRSGRYVMRRRLALGIKSQKKLAEKARVARRSVSALECGHPVSEAIIARIEAALGWADGSINRIIHGGEPSLRTTVDLDSGYRIAAHLEMSPQAELGHQLTHLLDSISGAGEATGRSHPADAICYSPGAVAQWPW